MKKLLFVIPLILFISSCNSDSGNNPLGEFGSGNNNNGNVTITVNITQDGQGQQSFHFTPSTSVVVDQVRIQCTAQQVDQTVQGDGQTAFTTADGFSVGPVDPNLLQAGQQWTFTTSGKVGTATGTAYTATSNLTVP